MTTTIKQQSTSEVRATFENRPSNILANNLENSTSYPHSKDFDIYRHNMSPNQMAISSGSPSVAAFIIHLSFLLHPVEKFISIIISECSYIN